MSKYCPYCGIEMDITSFEEREVSFGNITPPEYEIIWANYKCPECLEEIIGEPDWDSMRGGYDYERN